MLMLSPTTFARCPPRGLEQGGKQHEDDGLWENGIRAADGEHVEPRRDPGGAAARRLLEGCGPKRERGWLALREASFALPDDQVLASFA